MTISAYANALIQLCFQSTVWTAQHQRAYLLYAVFFAAYVVEV